jgi:hypothetical protein
MSPNLKLICYEPNKGLRFSSFLLGNILFDLESYKSKVSVTSAHLY